MVRNKLLIKKKRNIGVEEKYETVNPLHAVNHQPGKSFFPDKSVGAKLQESFTK